MGRLPSLKAEICASLTAALISAPSPLVRYVRQLVDVNVRILPSGFKFRVGSRRFLHETPNQAGQGRRFHQSGPFASIRWEVLQAVGGGNHEHTGILVVHPRQIVPKTRSGPAVKIA